MVAAFFGCSCFLACFGAGIITRPFSASRVTGNQSLPGYREGA